VRFAASLVPQLAGRVKLDEHDPAAVPGYSAAAVRQGVHGHFDEGA
jgi:hypothetical protein